MSIKPMTPKEARRNKSIPDFVIQAVNELLSAKYNGFPVSIKVDDIIAAATKISNPTVRRQEFFDNNWLDFECLYEEMGWFIEFHKPDMGQCFESHFSFKAK